MNNQQIEQARAEYDGDEFGIGKPRRPSPWAALLWIWAIAVFTALAVLALTACAPAVADVPADAHQQAASHALATVCKRGTFDERIACATDYAIFKTGDKS